MPQPFPSWLSDEYPGLGGFQNAWNAYKSLGSTGATGEGHFAGAHVSDPNAVQYQAVPLGAPGNAPLASGAFAQLGAGGMAGDAAGTAAKDSATTSALSSEAST